MIVNIGKRIHIESGDFDFKRDANTPGLVTVRRRRCQSSLDLPGNKKEAELFIAAYRRCIAEDIEYRKSEVE